MTDFRPAEICKIPTVARKCMSFYTVSLTNLKKKKKKKRFSVDITQIMLI